jgi:hypothetical protein
MVNKRVILFAEKFRSKAPSAASLSPGQMGNHLSTGFDFLLSPNCNRVSKGEGCLPAGRQGWGQEIRESGFYFLKTRCELSYIKTVISEEDEAFGE